MMDIKSIGLDMALRKLDEVTAQRDDLLAALKSLNYAASADSYNANVVREAIAKCEVKS